MEQNLGFEKREKEIERKFAERGSMINIEGIEDTREKEEDKDEKQARAEIAEELEKDKLSAQTKAQARMVANDIQEQSIERRVQRLLDLVGIQGLSFTVEVAEKMDSPLLLDKFHDALVQDKLFKRYLNK